MNLNPGNLAIEGQPDDEQIQQPEALDSSRLMEVDAATLAARAGQEALDSLVERPLPFGVNLAIEAPPLVGTRRSTTNWTPAWTEGGGAGVNDSKTDYDYAND